MAILTGAVASMMTNVNSVNQRAAVKLDQRDLASATNTAFRNIATCSGNLANTQMPNNPVNSVSSTPVDITSNFIGIPGGIIAKGLFYYTQPSPGVFVPIKDLGTLISIKPLSFELKVPLTSLPPAFTFTAVPCQAVPSQD